MKTTHQGVTLRRARLPILVGLALAASAGSGLAATLNSPADTRAITAIETEMANTTRPDTLLVHYVPDATVIDAVSPDLYQGTSQIRAGFTPQLAATKAVHATIKEITVASDGQFACDALTLHEDRTDAGGTVTPVELRKLDVFRNVNGHWLITQQQISMPADAKTGMILTDANLPVNGPMQWVADPFPGPKESVATARAGIKDWTDRGLRDIGIEHAMSYYGPGDDVQLYGEFAPGTLRGKPAIRAYYEPVMGSFNHIDVINPLFRIETDGLLGSQIDTQNITLHLTGGGTRPISLRQSDCLRVKNGHWYTFLEMVSFPMDPATGKAVMVSANLAH